MAHALELDANGQASAAFVVNDQEGRSEPWHRLGTYVPQAMTAAEALSLANLDWTAEVEDLYVELGNGGHLLVPGRKAVTRTSPLSGEKEVLGVTGNRWRPVDNERAFAFCDRLVDADGEAHYDTAGMMRPAATDGSLGLGAQVFITLRRPDLILDPNGSADRLRRYLFCANGFDGRRAFTVKNTDTRVVCNNTQEMALRGQGAEWKARHSASVEGKIEDARRALGFLTAAEAEFNKAAEQLIQTAMSLNDFDAMISDLFPAPKEDATKAVLARAEERRAQLHHLFSEAETQENIRGTAWAGYQSLIEYVDWVRPSRGDASGLKRATRTLTSSNLLCLKKDALARALRK